MENKITIKEAKQILKNNGYYVDNLWNVIDVMERHKVTEDEAYDILDESLQSEYIINTIFEQIDYTIKNKF